MYSAGFADRREMDQGNSSTGQRSHGHIDSILVLSNGSVYLSLLLLSLYGYQRLFGENIKPLLCHCGDISSCRRPSVSVLFACIMFSVFQESETVHK